MSKITLNFFGEETIVDTPKDMSSLRSTISIKYLFSKEDSAEIILYYIENGKKKYIINRNDLSQFKESKVSTIYLDVNQNSKLYLDSATDLHKENQKDLKELDELNKKFKDFSKKKEKIEHVFEDELKQINLKIIEMNKKKCEIIKKKDIELIKMIKEKEHFETKIYYLQKKLSLPITVPIPKDEKPKEISLKCSSKQLPMLKSFKNNTRFAPIMTLEIQKKIESAKCSAIAAAKAHSLKVENKANVDNLKKETEIEKKIKNAKTKSINKAKANALRVAKKAHEGIINKKNEIDKKIEMVKIKSIAKAEYKALKVGKHLSHDNLINKKLKIEKIMECVKLKSVSKAKSEALKIGNKYYHDKIINNKSEINKRVKIAKLKSIAKAKSEAIKIGNKYSHDNIINNKSEINKRVKIVKLKSVAKAKSEALKIGKKLSHDNIINKKSEINKKIEIIKLKSVTKAKSKALKIGKKLSHDNFINKISEINKRIENVKLKSIDKAKSESLIVGKREIEDMINKISKIERKIKSSKLKSVAKAKINALKVAKKAHNEIINKIPEIKKRIEIVKNKAISAAKLAALKVGERAKNGSNKDKNSQNMPNTVSVFQKVNEVLNNTIDKVKNVAKGVITYKKEKIIEEKVKLKKEEDKKIEEKEKKEKKEKKEQIEKIMKITKDAVNEINNLTKMVIAQSNILIEKINNPEKYANISSNEINLKSHKKEEKKRDAIHFHFICDGCKMDPIRGNRYKCKKCPDFDFCESCYQKEKESHGHEFMKIEKPKNTRRMGHKNTKYCQRGIVHRDIRCEGCGLDPFVGYRYMCTICDDYNLCENCEEELARKHNHPFIKVTYPSLLNSFNNCYLKMNYYESSK